jgi:hypothetical protein
LVSFTAQEKEAEVYSLYIVTAHCTESEMILSISLNNTLWDHLWRADETKYGTNNKTNSMALISKRTIPTERPPLVGEVSAYFSG